MIDSSFSHLFRLAYEHFTTTPFTMKSTTLLAAIVGTAGLALAQGVTSAIAPQATAPAGCSASYDGTFEITVAKVAVANKRDAPIAVSSCLSPPRRKIRNEKKKKSFLNIH